MVIKKSRYVSHKISHLEMKVWETLLYEKLDRTLKFNLWNFFVAVYYIQGTLNDDLLTEIVKRKNVPELS